MKFVMMIALTCMSLNAFPADDDHFAKVKTMMLTNIDKRLGYLQEHKTCVTAAADKDAMKACHDKHNAEMQSLHSDRKMMREQFKNERKEKKKS